ncbi:hypothetical protein BKA65DRAFT_113121 [Rhexocercosporidium sp. MPI-PUGE-AT-0058]|nr:hypothetical protein BKA65DRAFT_113121 [Rhexocercosporidium sp. MPI-PUGE-AT-0058]
MIRRGLNSLSDATNSLLRVRNKSDFGGDLLVVRTSYQQPHTPWSRLTKELDVYIRQYASYYLQNVLDGSDSLSHIFKMASCDMDQTIIQLSLKMWAANRLLMKGWEISGGDEFLGITIVNEPSSLLHNTIPAPRVLQNQLDHLLERQIFETEHKLLKELQKLIRRHDRGQ